MMQYVEPVDIVLVKLGKPPYCGDMGVMTLKTAVPSAIVHTKISKNIRGLIRVLVLQRQMLQNTTN